MFCAIMQPTYLPWIGYFHLIDSVEKFIFLDNVKLERSSWQIRNRIKTPQGELYLTVPVKNKDGRMDTLISSAQIAYRNPWTKKHLKSLFYNYQKSKFFDEIYPFIEEILSKEFQFLSELNIHIIKRICQEMGINVEFIISSQLQDIEGVKDERLVSLCKKIGCDDYLSPQGSAEYLEKETPGGQLVKNQISLFYQNFEHPEYAQLHGMFMGYLGVIDLLFNHGFNQSLAMIRSGARPMIDYLEFRKRI
jgi:hypothetical protein